MPTQTSDVLVDGTEIPLGPTLRGRAAREALPQLRRQPGLQHLGCIEPAGILSISFGLHPPRIAETLPASSAGDDRRRRISVKLPAADAWVQGEVAQTAALLLDLLARRGAIASAAQRRPGAPLNAAAVAEVERLIARQERRLEALA